MRYHSKLVDYSAKNSPICLRGYMISIYDLLKFDFAILFMQVFHVSFYWYYLPTPLLGQDMTQGQFLSGV